MLTVWWVSNKKVEFFDFLASVSLDKRTKEERKKDQQEEFSENVWRRKKSCNRKIRIF